MISVWNPLRNCLFEELTIFDGIFLDHYTNARARSPFSKGENKTSAHFWDNFRLQLFYELNLKTFSEVYSKLCSKCCLLKIISIFTRKLLCKLSQVPSARSQGTRAMIVVNLAKSWLTLVLLARSCQIMIHETQGKYGLSWFLPKTSCQKCDKTFSVIDHVPTSLNSCLWIRGPGVISKISKSISR